MTHFLLNKFIVKNITYFLLLIMILGFFLLRERESVLSTTALPVKPEMLPIAQEKSTFPKEAINDGLSDLKPKFPAVVSVDLGQAVTVVENKMTVKSSRLTEKMAELAQFMGGLKIDLNNDPEGMQWNAGLSALDLKLHEFLNDPTFSREEKMQGLWNLVSNVEYRPPVVDALKRLQPFEISDQIINTFITVAAQGESTVVRQLELLNLLDAGIKDVSREQLTADQVSQLEQATTQIKSLFKQQLLNYNHSAIFEDSLFLFYRIATLPEVIETFPEIADATVRDPRLKNSFYATWARSVFARQELQPAVEILFNSQLSKSDIAEVNFEVFEVLKYLSSSNIEENLRDKLVNYVQSHEPSTDNPREYLTWMSAYIAIQSPDESTKDMSLGHLIANDEANDVLLQAHAVEFLGSQNVLSSWETRDIGLLTDNFKKALQEPQISQEDKFFIHEMLNQLNYNEN